MADQLLLTDPANWAATPYQISILAERYGGTDLFIPIPKIQIPIAFESPILAIEAENPTALPWWELGCRVRQLFDTSGPPSLAGFQRPVLLNRGATLIQFPRYATQYRLEASIPKWHRQIKLSIWEYIGPITDTIEAAVVERSEQIRIDLQRIELRLPQP